ncbi:MAG: outer membrane protein assembly factor BamD [Chitinophagales bacterium]
MKKTVYITLLTLLIFISSCNTTEKILKSNDSNLKYTKAMEWYNKGQYFKAIPVFEELMGLFKGEKSTEEIYYYYCMAQFKQKSYLIAAFHFKNYTQKHPFSKYTEEALYMHAESYYKQTLDYSLDQTETVNSIDAYQTFINTYPSSSRIADANTKIDLLRGKLEKKAFKAAELYYKTKNYRAAAVSFKNLLIDYPDIDDVEDIQLKIVKSYYQYAEQSISRKQAERYNESIKAANNFLNRYPNNEFVTQVNTLKEKSHLEIIKSSLESALVSGYTKRIKSLEEMQDVYNANFSKLSIEKNKEIANKILEKSYFQQIKTEYLMAQESKIDKKAKHYKAAVAAFNVFSSKYNSSKFQNEAKRILSASEKNFKKYSNG